MVEVWDTVVGVEVKYLIGEENFCFFKLYYKEDRVFFFVYWNYFIFKVRFFDILFLSFFDVLGIVMGVVMDEGWWKYVYVNRRNNGEFSYMGFFF